MYVLGQLVFCEFIFAFGSVQLAKVSVQLRFDVVIFCVGFQDCPFGEREVILGLLVLAQTNAGFTQEQVSRHELNAFLAVDKQRESECLQRSGDGQVEIAFKQELLRSTLCNGQQVCLLLADMHFALNALLF